MEDEVNDQLVEQGKERSLKYDLRSHLSVPRSKLEYITTTTDSEAQGLPGSLNENDSMHFMSNDHMPRGTIKHSTGVTRAVHRVHTDQTVSPFHDFPLVQHKKIDYDQTVGAEDFGVSKLSKIDLNHTSRRQNRERGSDLIYV